MGNFLVLIDVLMLLELSDLVGNFVYDLLKVFHASIHLREVLILKNLENGKLFLNSNATLLRSTVKLPPLIEIVIIYELVVEAIEDFIV